MGAQKIERDNRRLRIFLIVVLTTSTDKVYGRLELSSGPLTNLVKLCWQSEKPTAV